METSALRLTRWTTHLLLALTVAGIMHAGWRLKNALSERENVGTTQNAVTLKLEDLTRNDPFRAIGQDLTEIDSANAQKKLKALKKNLAQLEQTLHITPEPLLSETLDKFEDSIQENTALSQPPELLNTLGEKATALRVLSQNRRWKNLAVYSTRLENRIRGLRQGGRVDSPQVRYAESDIASMERLTRTSTLDEPNKQDVLRRLEGLRQEISMLTDVHVASRKSNTLEASGREGLARWLGRARLSAGALKTAGDRRLQGAVQEIWVIGGLVMMVWIALGFLWGQALRAQRHAQDQGLLEILREGLMNHGAKWRQHVGEARLDEVERTLRQARKRMGLGDDVQAAMPFGSLMVDSHGKIVWANGLFCDEFHFDRESILEEDWKWDQVRCRLTGVPNTAVENALKTMEAGTWQIQAEVEKGVCIPYEMHISPVESKEGEGRKVFVVFYSMALMREAISDQARLVASPMRAAIQALENGTWSQETESRLAPLWSAAGLGEDWGRLSQAVHRLDGSRRDLLEQVTLMENTIHDQVKMIQELEMGIDRRISTVKEQIHSLKELRDGLISLDQLGRELGQGHGTVVQETKAFVKRTDIVRETMKTLTERLQAAKDSVTQLEKHKHDYKLEKQEISESKMELMKTHNRFLASLPEMSHNAELLAANMKDQLLRLDESVARLDSRLAQLDVQITKVAMACAGHVPETEKVSLDLAGFERGAFEIQKTMQEDQEHVVTLLRDLVEALRHDQQELVQLREGMPVTNTTSPDTLYPFV